jgi:hypothetical protein
MFKNNKLLKKILPELIWVVIIIIASMLLHIAIWGYEQFWSETLDIQLHDTYFVLSGISLKILVFIVLYIPISLIRLLWNYLAKQETIRPFLFYNGFVMLIFIVVIIFYTTYKDAKNGWVFYPPLAEYPQAMPPNPIITYFYEISVVVLCLLFLVSTGIGIKFTIKYYENKPVS